MAAATLPNYYYYASFTIYVYLEYHNFCPLVWIGTSTPSPTSECVLIVIDPGLQVNWWPRLGWCGLGSIPSCCSLTICQCIQYNQHIKNFMKTNFLAFLLLLMTLIMFASLQLPVIMFLLLKLLMLQAGGGCHGDTSWCCQGKFIMISSNMGTLIF